MAESRKYLDTPATVLDVVAEFTEVARLVSLADANSSIPAVDQERCRKQLAIAQSTLAMALESWLGTSGQEMAGIIVAGLQEPLLSRLASLHDTLHEE